MTFYFRYEKARMARTRIAEANKGIGKPLVGGAFHLTDHNGKDFTQDDLKGKYSLVYFGFTHCPDICPEELDKMAGMIDQVKEKHGEGVMRNVFISCDPARDTPEVIRRYLAEFHEDILGMTGTWQEVKDVCKAYRVYFSTPADVQPGQDYLVDHSIYFYLMGEFGRNCVVGEANADFIAQILRATLLRPLDATSPLMRPPRSSTTTSPTGGVRLTGHEDCRADVYGYVRYCTLRVNRSRYRSLVQQLGKQSVAQQPTLPQQNRFMGVLSKHTAKQWREEVNKMKEITHFPYTQNKPRHPIPSCHPIQPIINRRLDSASITVHH